MWYLKSESENIYTTVYLREFLLPSTAKEIVKTLNAHKINKIKTCALVKKKNH